MKKEWIIASLLGFGVMSAQPAFAAVVVAEQSYPIVEEAPPADMVEAVIPSPGPDHVWVKGNWRWDGRWVWNRGYWAHRPHPAAVWVEGGWGRHYHHGWHWHAGYWR